VRCRLREALVGLLVAGLLAGCATVPTSGPVRTHDASDQQVNSSVQVAPVPPADGASEMLVVEGFLHAMGTDQTDYQIARQYLTPAASEAWHPETGASVYADGTLPTETESSVVLLATVVGTLDSGGGYQELPSQLRHDFGLVKNAQGQWRISHPPRGLLISRYHFTTFYTGVELNFLDRTGVSLVPDPRFFPLRADLPGTAVRAQLAGANRWLAPAVRKWDSGTITAERVTLTAKGLLEISLAASAKSLPDKERRSLMAELVQTGVGLPGVTAVRFLADGAVWTLPGAGATDLTPRDFPGLSPTADQAPGRLFVSRDDKVHQFDIDVNWSDAVPVAPGLTRPGALAVRGDLGQIATVSQDGRRVLLSAPAAAASRVVASGSGMLRPDFSRQGELWVLGGATRARDFIVLGGSDSHRLEFTVSKLPNASVRAFALSPDGSRMALILRGDDSDQLGIARVVRTGDAVGLEEFRSLAVFSSIEAGRRLLDVGWTTGTQMLALVSHPDQALSVVRIDQDAALSEDIGPNEVRGLSELAVVPGRPAVVRGGAGAYRYEGDFNWKLTLPNVDHVAYSG